MLTISKPWVVPDSISIPRARNVLKIARAAATDTAGVSQIYREHAMRAIYLPRYIYIDSNNCWIAKGESVEESELVEKSRSVELYQTYPVVAKGGT
ncbi:MAG: hypothetical protein KDI33_02960 [Halioglobus sp.]|nr:hypothetical protein [Halioglobus sp.]